MNIIKNAKIWFSFSFVLILISLASFVLTKIDTGSFLRYSIDFTGGTLLEIQLEDETKKTEDVQTALLLYQEEYTPFIQTAEENTFIIKMKNVSNEVHDEIIATLRAELGSFEENRFITIGPTVGETMKSKAFIALLVALIAIVLYIAFAFREIPKELSSWKFGFSAIVALAHDVIITIGLFAILGIIMNIEIDMLFITALLTVMGFSVHDTIVVFDRLRENSRFARPTETFADIGEKSVKQTINRSINTSISTLFPLLALFFFGAESIHMFVLALIIGIIIGTYSSIFLAAPVLVHWQGANKSNLRLESE
jgi:preprotein translocase subunit SecF